MPHTFVLMLDARYLSVLWSALLLLGATTSSRAQFRANGYIDTSFTAPCLANNSVDFAPRAFWVQPDDRILVGGHFGSPAACANALIRLRTNGVTDTTFSSPFAATDFVAGIGVQSNGKAIVGGRLTGSGMAFPVTRLGTNGALDGSFTRLNNPLLVANALAVQPIDDRIVVAGAANTGSGIIGFVSRFDPNGATDNNFVSALTDVTLNNQGISAVALQGSKIIIGGNFKLVNNTNREGLAWLNGTDGSLDLVLRAPITNADVRAILLQPDGKILVAGNFTTDTGANAFLTRLNAGGLRDTSFTTLHGFNVFGLALALQPDGKILLSHNFGVVRITTNGVIDESFGPLNAQGFLGTDATLAFAVARTADGNVLVGAARVNDGITTRRGVARLLGNVPPPPVITQQPATQNVEAGANATFSIIATGAPPILFQWRKNAVAIKGETNSTLLLVDVDSTDAGNYTVIASNPGGSVTSLVAKLFVNFQTAPLTLITNGAGVILPKLSGELEIGREFSITARPVSGNIFSNWLSGISPSEPQPIVSGPTLTFVMQSNLTIVANFVPSPFIPVVGVYNGLFFDTNSPAHANAGAFTATLDANGGLKGSVRMGTRVRKFTTAFSAERIAVTNIAATATDPALTMALELDAINSVMTGTISFSSNITTLRACRNPFSNANRASTAGLYNGALPGADDPTLAPAGDGFTALTVSTAGRVSGKGTLADGTALKIAGATSRDAQVPVYVPLYSGRGSVFGWLTVTNGDLNDVAGTLWWTKPGTVGGAFYPKGFSNQIETIGSRYVAPPSGTPVLTLVNGVATLSGGDLISPLTNSITLGGDNKIASDNQLTLAISAPKGAVKGSFVDASSNTKRSIKGIALPKQNQARGFFLGADQSGRLFVGEAAP